MGERVDDDDELLGLSLGLGSGHPEKNRRRSSASASAPRSPSLELNLSLASHARSNPPENSQAHRRHPISCNLQLRHSEVNLDPRPPFNSGVGFDVNGAPLPHLPFPEDDNAASSPNSTLSSISAGKRVEREVAGDNDNEGERTSCSRGSDEDDGGGGGGGGDGEGRKKLRLSREQSMVLEETFKAHSTLNPKQKLALAEKLNLRPRQVEVWFQNRRARTKLKQTEVDCEYLKRCCENLTQENRRLQKEVQELRALKLSPHLYMHLNPPTTLTMCPSCERVAALSTSAPAAANLPPGR